MRRPDLAYEIVRPRGAKRYVHTMSTAVEARGTKLLGLITPRNHKVAEGFGEPVNRSDVFELQLSTCPTTRNRIVRSVAGSVR